MLNWKKRLVIGKKNSVRRLINEKGKMHALFNVAVIFRKSSFVQKNKQSIIL